MSEVLVPIRSPALSAPVTVASERAGVCFTEFFAANIRNPTGFRMV
jgi:hypothetical protein